MRRIALLTVLLLCFAGTSHAQLQNCISAGGGDLLQGIAGPVRGARQMGSNQYYSDPANPLVWNSESFTTWMYDVADSVLYGQMDRGGAEGAYYTSSAKPDGSTTCGKAVPGTPGHMGPCPNEMITPDVCGYITGQYSTRFVANPIFYAPITWGNITGDFINAGTDAALLDMTSVATDFASPTKPPFATGAIAYQNDVALQPWSGSGVTEMHMPVAVDSPVEGWQFGEVSEVDTIAQQFYPSFGAFPSQETIFRGGRYYIVHGYETTAENEAANQLQLSAKDAGAPLYVHTINSKGASCWVLMGSLLEGRNLSGNAIFQSMYWNVIPALDAAIDGGYGLHHASLEIAGSCTAVGPATASGNYDPDNFLWYTQAQIDQTAMADTTLINWENGNSDGSGGGGTCPPPPTDTNGLCGGTAGGVSIFSGYALKPSLGNIFSPPAAISVTKYANCAGTGCVRYLWTYCQACTGLDTTFGNSGYYNGSASCSGPDPGSAYILGPTYLDTMMTCNGSGGGGGGGTNNPWGQTILTALNAGMSTLNSTSPPMVGGVGFTDDGVDPTTPFLSVSIDCAGGCTPPAGQTVQSYVTGLVLNAANVDGTTVATSLANFGLPSKINVNVGAARTPTTRPTQYYTGLLNGFISSADPTVVAINFNAPAHSVNVALLNEDTQCLVTAQGAPFAVDVNVTTRLFETFSTTLTITGSSNCGTRTQAQVGQQIILNGTGTCYSADPHELCNQQFTLTGSAGALNLTGNLMGTPQGYTGPSTGSRMMYTVPQPLVKKVTGIPAVPNMYWTATGSAHTPVLRYVSGVTNLTARVLASLVGPGQENAMVAASISGIAGPDPGDGLGTIVIGQMGGTGNGKGSIAGF